jgi:5'-methylthioadenosine phosphorylase
MDKIGIIGGSGLYDIEDLKNKKWHKVKTPYGEPSDKFLCAQLAGREVVFLPRHGRGHFIPPSAINYRANIYGFKTLEVKQIISVSACGSLKEEYKPLDFVIPDQFVDRTTGRNNTFFDTQAVAHVDFSRPVCPELADTLHKIAKEVGVEVHRGGTYINIEGPQFSTLAESNLYRSWGMDIIGMTNVTEAKLAREAEICYATLAAVTDYDCWHQSEETVNAQMVIETLLKNIDNAKKILYQVLQFIDTESKCGCRCALKDSVVTDFKSAPASIKKKFNWLVGKYL